MSHWKTVYLPAVFRIIFSFIFLWAFLDKTFGLGFSTPRDKAWLNGGSPTMGFLSGVKGPFASLFNMLAGSGIVDWLFMLGLLGIGIGLLLGIAKKITGWSGVLLMFFMWLAVLPIKTNPFVDDHIIYIFLFIIYTELETIPWSLNNWWNNTNIVKENTWLE